MVKRFAWKRYAYMVFAFLVLLACWESQRSNVMIFAAPAAESKSGNAVIPQESIRFRILANSDSPSDQWIKREVRDAVVEQMKNWADEPRSIDDARQLIGNHLPELETAVGKTLHSNGFDYDYRVELGMVPFPVKVYNNQVYPAGDYEALRISIGAAEGQNWWCVLFPPLCFADSSMMAKKNNTAYAAEAEPVKNTGKEAKDTSKTAIQKAAAPKPEVHFFLWDFIKKLWS